MKFVLAPLAGFTDAPFRLMCRDGGASLAYTEMVSAAGLFHGSRPTRQLMEMMPGEGPVACQLFGAKEEELAFAAAEAGKLPFCEINLNAGCPMPKVTREGAGAKIVESPDLAYRLVKAMVANTSLPVTVKTRLGPRPGRTTVFEILDAVESAGAAGIAVHARYVSQMHGGPLHLDTLAEVVARAHIPVTGNGSVTDAATAARMAQTGVGAIMIGRAALADPGLFARLADPSAPPAFTSRGAAVRLHLERILDFRRRLAEAYSDCHVPGEDAYASVKMHVHLFRYFNGLPGAAKIRARLNSIRTLAEIREILHELAP